MEPTVTIPTFSDAIQYGALGILAVIVFAVIVLGSIFLWKIGAPVVAAIQGIAPTMAKAIAEQGNEFRATLREMDERHRESYREMSARFEKVLDDIKDEIRADRK